MTLSAPTSQASVGFPATINKKAAAIAIGCWIAAPINIGIAVWQDHILIITTLISLAIAINFTWIARFWSND